MSEPRPENHPATGTEPTVRALLRDRSFALYLVGQTTSGAGSALSAVALVFAVLSVSRSAAGVGLVLLCSRLPAIGLSLAGGVLADRLPRRWIAVGCDAARTASQALTGLLLLGGHATLAEIAALQVCTGGAGTLFSPAATALLAGVAPHGEVRRGNSLLGITTSVTQTGGLAAAGAIVALAGPGAALLIDAATFAVSTLSLVCLRAPADVRRETPARSVRSDIRDGGRVLRERRWPAIYAAHETIVNVLVLSPFFVLGPVVAKDRLGGAPAWSAIALGYVVGNLVASHVTLRWAPRRPIRSALAVSVGLAPMIALIGLAAPLWLIVPAALLAGAQTTIWNTLQMSVMQANLPDEALGRATALTGLGSTVLVPIGMGLAGIAAGALGTEAIMLSGAAVILLTSGACALCPSSHAVLALQRTR